MALWTYALSVLNFTRRKSFKIGHFGDLGVEKMFTKKLKIEEKKVFLGRKTALEE